MKQAVFISYKRAEPTTSIARRLYMRIKVNLEPHGFAQTFFDEKSIEAGNPWSPEIDAALKRTTHFVALLSDEYWMSEQCQRELRDAVALYERSGVPRLLFVLTELMDPTALRLDKDSRSADVVRRFPEVQHLGQINFLGPYDAAGRLVRLSSESVALSDELFRLTQAIGRIGTGPASDRSTT